MRVTVRMLEAAGWHRVQTRRGWNLWAHGAVKKSHSFDEAARIFKEMQHGVATEQSMVNWERVPVGDTKKTILENKYSPAQVG